jgi:hypothetical protein
LQEWCPFPTPRTAERRFHQKHHTQRSMHPETNHPRSRGPR